MIRYPRPATPEDFPTTSIHKDSAALKDTCGACECPEHWRDYKPHFYNAQHGKCAWCEAENTSETGAVDHYAPKKEVGRLERAGQERPGSTNVRGRSIVPVHAPGYWWLALEWDNWLFACNRCNSGWKGTLFPVAESPHPPPDPSQPYTPLLLDPYGEVDPIDHMDFSDLGQIEALNSSPRGRATIDTCGLDRESLRRAREKRARAAMSWVHVLLARDTTEELRKHAWVTLRQMGDAREPFAATTRCVIRRHLGIRWEDLQTLPLP